MLGFSLRHVIPGSGGNHAQRQQWAAPLTANTSRTGIPMIAAAVNEPVAGPSWRAAGITRAAAATAATTIPTMANARELLCCMVVE
jgi:hypothetical protein